MKKITASLTVGESLTIEKSLKLLRTKRGETLRRVLNDILQLGDARVASGILSFGDGSRRV